MLDTQSIHEIKPLLSKSGEVRVESLKKSKKGLFLVAAAIALGIAAFLIYSWAPTAAKSSRNLSSDFSWATLEDVRVPENNVWSYSELCDDEESIKLTFAIKMQNTEKIDEMLMEVADPKSPKYGQYYAPEDLKETFQPSAEAVEAVTSWLIENGVSSDDIHTEGFFNAYVVASTNIKTANSILNTKYGKWTHQTLGKTHVRVESGYYVPSHLTQYLDFVSPTVRFPPAAHTSEITLYMKESEINADSLHFSDPYVYPSKLRSLYSMTLLTGKSSLNSQGIASFLGEWYNDHDVSLFWENFDIIPATTIRVPEIQPDGDGSEAELDVQYITSMGQGITTYVWDIEDDNYFISLVTQLLAAPESQRPLLVSMSYGGDEQSNGRSYCTRGNYEFGIASMCGITFFASSGDSGATDSGYLIDGEFVPSFPASSPYVTAVGGTTGGTIPSSIDDSTNEEGWYYSGGGFSVYFDQQSWQTDAVSYYLENCDTLPDSSRFNSSKRAYPDISARGNYYIIVVDGSLYSVSGTSASSPTIAGMFALINDQRLTNGKSSLGFLNPLLYSAFGSNDFGTIFNDPVLGYNEGPTQDDGIAFYCWEGWDPVTGVGSPKFDKMMQYFI